MSVKTILPSNLKTNELHGYLLAAIAPRPIALASTIDHAGNVNLSPFSFFNVFGMNPPIMIFSPSRKVQGNTNKHTLENVQEVKEVVINIVNYPIVEQMSLSSTQYDKGVNEFIKAGLRQVPSTKIKPPRVGEAPVAFECKVLQVIETGENAGAGNLVICEVLCFHIREEYLDEKGHLDTQKLDLVARMGANWYCRASGEALFEVTKPISTLGIGVDALPEKVRNSKILTGNNLGRLGNLEKMPSEQTITTWKQTKTIQSILKKYKHQPTKQEIALHELAKGFLEENQPEAAMKTLLVY